MAGQVCGKLALDFDIFYVKLASFLWPPVSVLEFHGQDYRGYVS